MYGVLLATFTTHNAVWCIVQGFLSLVSLDEQPILNPYDCPLLELSSTIFCTPSATLGDLHLWCTSAQVPVSFKRLCKLELLRERTFCVANWLFNMTGLILLIVSMCTVQSK